MSDFDRIEPEDILVALRDWAKEEVKRGPADRRELGRFLFTVSSATIGIILTIAKLVPGDSTGISANLFVSLLILLVSILTAIYMAKPHVWRAGARTSLLQEYQKQVEHIETETLVWVVSWVIGTILGVMAIF
jgi:hypothetical protein